MDANLLLAATGSVAAVKIPLLLQRLRAHPLHVRLIVTQHARHFVDTDQLQAQGTEVLLDENEWSSWTSLSDPVLHIELRKWADALLIAPLDANTMAKMATGMCDNLLTCVVRAWDRSKPLLFCPAMNTMMWEHPVTEQQRKQLLEWGHTEVPPVVKRLACGDHGCGGMADVDDIVRSVVSSIMK